MSICIFYRSCGSNTYENCSNNDFVDTCRIRDITLADIVRQEQIEKAERLGKPIVKYKCKSFEEFTV